MTTAIRLVELGPDDFAAWREGLAERMTTVRLRGGYAERQAHDLVTGFLGRADPAGATAVVRRVVADGAPVGTVFAGVSSPTAPFLADLDVPPERADATVTALGELLAEGGATELQLSSFVGDAPTEAVVEARSPRLAATRMQLDLATPTPEDLVRLEPMTGEQYADYRAVSDEGYAQDLFASGGFGSLEEARASAAKQFVELLPDGLESTGHRLWHAYADGRDVGLLWIWLDGAWAYIYDIRMDEALRGRGYGTGTLRAGANAARDAGAAYLGLNVFGQNEGARRLYERSGYDTVERFWVIPLG
ncbi:MAG: GNAT family N-acetyltransferase [Nocardioides sp.]